VQSWCRPEISVFKMMQDQLAQQQQQQEQQPPPT